MESVLTLEVKIAKLEMVMKHRMISHNGEKITLLKNATDLELKQLYEHKKTRTKEIEKIINKYEGSFVDINDIKLELKQYKEEYLDISDKIDRNNIEISELMRSAIGGKKCPNLTKKIF
jgi:uncharacterized protein (DUF111 family)